MTSKRRVLQRRKSVLLQAIAAERETLRHEATQWHAATQRLDNGWAAIMRYRPLLMGAGALLALTTLKKPLHLVRWGRKALSLWTSYQLLKRTSTTNTPKDTNTF